MSVYRLTPPPLPTVTWPPARPSPWSLGRVVAGEEWWHQAWRGWRCSPGRSSRSRLESCCSLRLCLGGRVSGGPRWRLEAVVEMMVMVAVGCWWTYKPGEAEAEGGEHGGGEGGGGAGRWGGQEQGEEGGVEEAPLHPLHPQGLPGLLLQGGGEVEPVTGPESELPERQ